LKSSAMTASFFNAIRTRRAIRPGNSAQKNPAIPRGFWWSRGGKALGTPNPRKSAIFKLCYASSCNSLVLHSKGVGQSCQR
jgi:hypothetical protein